MLYRLSEAYIKALQPYFNFFFYFMLDKKTSLYPVTMFEMILYKIDTKVFHFFIGQLHFRMNILVPAHPLFHSIEGSFNTEAPPGFISQ